MIIVSITITVSIVRQVELYKFFPGKQKYHNAKPFSAYIVVTEKIKHYNEYKDSVH